jgi:hypothetical protein
MAQLRGAGLELCLFFEDRSMVQWVIPSCPLCRYYIYIYMKSFIKRHARRVDAGRAPLGPAGTKIFGNPHVGEGLLC